MLEEILKWLKTDEGKEAIGKIASATGMKTEDEFNRVVSKKDEILDEKKKLQIKYKKFEGANIDVDKYTKAVDALEELEEAGFLDEDGNVNHKAFKEGGNSEEYDIKIKRLEKQYARELAEANKKSTSLEERNNGLINKITTGLIKDQLMGALETVNVSSKHKDMVYGSFLHRASVEQEGDDEFNVVIKDDDGTPLSVGEFFKSWAGSEQAKLYIQAPETTGGGSGGGAGGGKGSGEGSGDAFSEDQFSY